MSISSHIFLLLLESSSFNRMNLSGVVSHNGAHNHCLLVNVIVIILFCLHLGAAATSESESEESEVGRLQGM